MGKSEIVSRRFPSWYLGNNPHRQVILSTYGQDLSDRMSRDVRRVRESTPYEELFGPTSYGAMNKVAEWNLEQGGVFKAVGVGGPVTGFGANILIIDDPVKNREEAESEVIREKTWSWFNNDVLTRLEAPNAVVVCATRWHEEDLIGRILASPDADEWVVLHLDHVCDPDDDIPSPSDLRVPGAPLWPGRLMLPWEFCPELAQWPKNSAEVMADIEFDELDEDELTDSELLVREQVRARPFDPEEYAGGDAFFKDSANVDEAKKIRVSLKTLVLRDLKHYQSFVRNDPYGASALQQGRPTPKGGTLVDPDAVNYYTGSPDDRAAHSQNLVISVDANFKKTKTSDFAAATVFGRTSRPNALYWIDEFHGRVNYPQLKRGVKKLLALYPRASVLIEAKANGQALIDDLREEGFGRIIAFEPDKHGSKESRAQVAAEFVAGGGLFVPTPQKGPKSVEWLEEVTKYGTTKHDDRMDTLSQAVIHYSGSATGLNHLRRIVSITDAYVA